MMANDSITNKNKGAEKVVDSIAEPPTEQQQEEEVLAIEEEEVIMDMKMSSTSATVPVESNDITNTQLYDTMIDEDVLSSPVTRGRTTKEDTKDNDDNNNTHEMMVSPRSVLESGVVSSSSEATTNFLKGLEMEEEEEHNDDSKQPSINIQASSNNLNIENVTDSSSIDTANGVSTTDSSEGNENSSNSIVATPRSVKCNSPSSSHNHSNNIQYTQSNVLFQYVLNVSCWHLVSKRALTYKDEAKYIDEYGRTSLHLACMPAAQGYDTLGIMVGNGQMKPYTTAPPQLQIVKSLIHAYPLGIYKQNKWGCTPLHFASLYSHHTVLELLLQSELTLQVQQQPQHKQELSQRSCILYITNEDGHIPLYHMSMWYTFLLQRTLVRVRQEIKFLQTLKDKSLTEGTKKEENIQLLWLQQGGTTATTSTTFTLYDRARQIIFDHDPEVRRVWHNIMVLVCSMYYGVVLPVSLDNNDNDNDKHNFSVDEYTKSLPKSNSDDNDDDDDDDEEEITKNESKSKSIKRSRPFLAPKKKKKGSLFETNVPAVEDDHLSIPGDLSSSSSSFEYDINHCHGYKRYMVHACVGLDIYNKSHDTVGNKLMTAASATAPTTINTTNNDFQSTIRTCCPSDVLDVALWLHRDELCIQEETYGNLPLHLAILKYSEAIVEKSKLQQQEKEHGKTKASHNNNDNDDDEGNTISSSTTENDYYENVINERRTILKKVLHAYPEATSVYNFEHKLPLHMSIELLGRYDPDIVALIYITYPSAASVSIPSSLAFVQQQTTDSNTDSNNIQSMIKKKKQVSSLSFLVWPFMMMASNDVCATNDCINNTGNDNIMKTESGTKQQENNEDMLVEIDNNNNNNNNDDHNDDDDDTSSNDNNRSIYNSNEDDNENNDLIEPPNIVRLLNHRSSNDNQEQTEDHPTTTKKKNNTCFTCFDVTYMLLRACPEMERFYT